MADPAPHVLFVDDESALRTLMAERLRDRGYEVVEAESGEKAVNLLEQFAFDVAAIPALSASSSPDTER
jgi:CheY-like chemotaxis protein